MNILVFDVNETLLNLSPLDAAFAQVFDDPGARQEWFNLLLQRAFTATLTNDYRDFSELGRSALHMIASKRNVHLDEAKTGELLGIIRHLPPHPEVADALEALYDAGFALTALTQSPAATLEAQMNNSGLSRFFTRLFSVDAVKRYKPDPAPYRMVATEMHCNTSDMRLIAAHAWDVEGAMRVGCEAAFVARPGQVLDPSVAAPGIVGTNLRAVAREILATANAIEQ